jgi:hypothetical protein
MCPRAGAPLDQAAVVIRMQHGDPGPGVQARVAHPAAHRASKPGSLQHLTLSRVVYL